MGFGRLTGKGGKEKTGNENAHGVRSRVNEKERMGVYVKEGPSTEEGPRLG